MPPCTWPLTAPTSRRGVFAERIAKLGPGTHAIAFHCSDLERGLAEARALGLVPVRRGECGPLAREVEFEAEAGVIVKLVERSRPSRA